MKDQRKTKARLIKELEEMRARVSEVEASEAEHERAEEKIRHLNAVLRAIRNVNQLITKEKDLGRLLHGICDNLVQNRGYHNVWIAFLDEFKGLVATAEAGLGEAFQPIAQRLRRGMFMGCGQKALARPGVVVTEDPFSECVDCPLAAGYGGRGAMTVRLEFEGNIYGLLAVSVPRHLAMDEEERNLFREVAEDIAFALHNIELEEGRKLAGESLRLAAAYARNLIETCLDPLATIDEEGKITDVNAAAEEITGYSRERLIGTEFSAYFTDPEKVKEGHQEAFSKGSVRDYDLEIWRRDGHVTPVLYNASVYRDETGRIAGVVAAARDVTEWKKAEKALKDSEARYRALFETSADGILVADRKTKKFIYANPAICGMLGYTEEELTQRGVQDIHPKESLEYVFAEFKGLSTGKRAFGRDVPCLKSDGTIFYVDLSAGVSVVDGKECGIGVFRDTTDRKMAEEALKESEARYRALFETSVDGILVADGKTKKFIYANPAICGMLGYTEEELTRRGIQDIHPKESLEYVLSEFKIQTSGERSLSRDMPCLKSDGTVFYADVNAGESVVDGRQCAIGVFRDTTDRKKAEEALRDSEELFRTLFETAPICLVLTSPFDGTIVGCNQKAAELFGGSPEEFIGRKSADFYGSSKERSRVIAALEEHGSFKDMEVAFKTLDGRPFLGLFSGTMTKYSGEPVRLAVIVDITERKRAEEALKDSEELFRTLFETAPIGLVLTKPSNGLVVSCNQKGMELFGGSSPEDLIGRNAADFYVTSEDRLRMVAIMEEHEAVKDIEIAFKTLDGRSFLALFSGTMTKYGGKPTILSVVVDITERKQAERALKENESRYRAVFENMSSGVAVYEAVGNGADFIFKDFNAAGEKIDKVKRERLIGRGVCEVFPGVKDFGLFDVLKKVWETGEPEFFPLTLYQDERVSGWRENFVCKLPSGEVVAVYDDITDRKEAEDALKDSEELFRTLFETAPIGLVLSNPSDGTLVGCNQRTAELFGGSSPEDFIGRKASDFYVVPEDRSRMLDALKEHGYFKDVEVAFKTLDGRLFQGLFSGTMTKYSGKPVILAVIVDITDRKKAEEALKESEELFRTLFETAPTGLVLTRIPGGTVVACNQKTAEMFGGSSPDEITGKNAVDFYVYPEDRSRVVESMQKHGMIRDFEIAFKALDGRQFWVLACGAMTRYGGEPVMLSVLADITDRKQAEEALQKARNDLESRVEERTSDLIEVNKELMREIKERIRAEGALKSSIAEKEILIREIHHRVKNNLQVISSLLDMGNMRIRDASQAHEMFKEAGSIIQAMALIHSMLYGARQFESVNIADFVRKLYAQLAQMYVGQSKKITPEFHLEDVHLSIDRAVPLGLVLNEILANVFKHAFPGDDSGKVEIHLRKDDKDMVFLRILDDGTGIPEEIDVEAANSMGLKLIRIIVREQLRGALSVERGRGTTVSMEFVALRTGDSDGRANA